MPCSGLHLFSNRRLDNKFNIFEGIHRNWFFIGINLITISGQVLILCLGGSAMSTIPLDAKQWGISIMLGAISLPVAVLIRLIPNDFIRKFIPSTLDLNQILGFAGSSDERLESGDGVEDTRE